MERTDRYIVLDTETTGLHREARVIELAAVKVEKGVIVDQRTQFFDPGEPLPPVITRLTGITDDMVRGKATAAQVLPRFLQFTEGLPIVGHNIRFDLARLKYEAERCGMELPLLFGADTVMMARQRVPREQVKSFSLHDLVDHFRIEQQPAHRALADVYATWALYELLLTMPRLPRASLRVTGRNRIACGSGNPE